ncbi:TPA: hypothetical protein QC119_005177 [Bacillus cereus]|nr:hypothetical protein [Bacillus cereus]HDR8256003.1 hypothetical protein [Bacillus cereus]
MAKRPTMKQLQTNDQQLSKKLARLEQTVNDLKAELSNTKERLGNAERRDIINYLKEKNFSGSSKYRYTYEEIAQIFNTSPSTIAKIAKDEGLSRRTYKVL